MKMRSLSAMMAAVVLASCDTLPNVRLHNGLGVPVVLRIEKGGQEAHEAHLAPGGSVRIWNIYGPDFRLSANGCEYRFRLPDMDLNFPWRVPLGGGRAEPDYKEFYPVEIQVQPDFMLFLRPHGAPNDAVSSAEELRKVQAHGYPLHPVAKICR